MKKNILCLLLILSIFVITGGFNNKQKLEDVKKNDNSSNNNESEIDDNMEIIKKINIVINDKEYNATLEGNETAQTFVKLLPQEFNMSELNGNEKYVYMDISLPTNSSNPKHIEAGDIMLYGNNCLVIFYKSFDTNYSYTKIGHVDNLPDLGNSDITIKFEK